MVYRIYVEKKAGLAAEADSLRADIVNLLGISGLEGLRLLNRYDVERIDRDLFEYCKKAVFSEPQLDDLKWNRERRRFRWNIFRDSLTREQILLRNVSRLFQNRNVRLCVQQGFICFMGN